MSDLTITLTGGSSCPLAEVAMIIQVALTNHGLNVEIELPKTSTDEWKHGWDGFLSNESVVIRYDGGSK